MFENLGKITSSILPHLSKENNIISLTAFKYVNTFQTKVLNFYCIQQRKLAVKPVKMLSFRKVFLKADINPPKFLLKF